MKHQHYRLTALAISLSAALTACGGGGGSGGNVKPTPPPPTPPAPAVCDDDNATNKGGALPCTYRYNGEADNLLVPARADLAHAEGFTGEGVKVGVLDGPKLDSYPALEHVSWYKDYQGGAEEPDTNEKIDHGMIVAATAFGRPDGSFKGGVAPDAEAFWARICLNDECNYGLAREAIREMGDAGVRLFNFSIGPAYETAEERTDEILREHGQASAFWLGQGVKDVDGLFVNAGGNQSYDEVGGNGLAPLFAPELRNHWLTVVALDVDGQGNATTLSDYSNACGRAAEWCLAAPGLVQLPGMPGESGIRRANGTSLATPIVTGTAALVWQAFPWMSASNVQQTVLTTATDLGEPGVDAVFGWGLVNAEKAVRGPGQFTGDFNADVDDGRWTFANDISGAGGLTKAGEGTLELSGANTYANGTAVNAGTLVLSGSLGSSVVVRDGASFIADGGSVGGNYNAFAGSTTSIVLGKPLEIAGKATLNGGLTLLPEASDYSVGASEKLIGFGSREGEFTDVTYGSGFFYTAKLDYRDTSLFADLSRISAAGVAQAAGAPTHVVAGGRQADALFGFTDTLAQGAGRDRLLTAAAKLANAPSADAAQAALASLTGEVHGTARAVAIQQAVTTDQLLGDRVATLDPDTAGVWFAGSVVDGAFERSGFADADTRQESITFGVDRAFGNGIAGLALTTGEQRADLDALGGDFDTDTDAISAYARLGGSDGYLSATATYARGTVDTQRRVLLGNDVLGVSGRHKDTTWSARIEGGRSYGLFTPFLAGGWISHEQGAFAEAGGDGLGLSARSDDASIHYGELGVRLAKTWDRLTLRGVLAGRWAGGDTTPGYGAWFTDAPEAGFTVSGQRVPGRAARAGVGIEFASSPNVLWGFDVGGESASGSADSAWATGSLRIAF